LNIFHILSGLKPEVVIIYKLVDCPNTLEKMLRAFLNIPFHLYLPMQFPEPG
jgi:hypothetical protein